MDSHNLVVMANRIGDFFKAMPERDEALDGIVDHIKKFWEPRMRSALSLYLLEQNGYGLQPIVLEALQSRIKVWQ